MYQARETAQRKAQIAEIERRTGLDGFSSVVDFALSYTIATLGQAERPEEEAMYTLSEAKHKSDPIYTVFLTEGEPSEEHPSGGYYIEVAKEGFPPHSSEFFEARENAEDRFEELTGVSYSDTVTIEDAVREYGGLKAVRYVGETYGADTFETNLENLREVERSFDGPPARFREELREVDGELLDCLVDNAGNIEVIFLD